VQILCKNFVLTPIRFAKAQVAPPTAAAPPSPPNPLLPLLPPQGRANGALVLGPDNAPTVVFSADSISVEWGKPSPADDMTDEERRRYVLAPDEPSLLVSGSFGKLRVFPPPAAVKVFANNLEPLALGLASHEIDRLPWGVEEEAPELFCRSLVLRR